MANSDDQRPWLIFYTLLLLDLIVVFLHIWGGFETELLNLDAERNIPTIYQTIKFIFIGFLCWGTIMQMKLLKILDQTKAAFWGILGSVTIYLGLDELGELHENLDKLIRLIIPNIDKNFDKYFFSQGYVSSPWILYNLLALIIVSPLIIWMFYTSIKLFQKRNIYLLTTFICFLIVIFLEFVSTSWVHPWIYRYIVVVEELTEMFAISILSIFASIEFFNKNQSLQKKLKK